MAHFQVFLPHARGQNPQQLVAVGLADLVEGAEFSDVASGPSGGPGVLCAWRWPGDATRPAERRMHFAAAEQTWLPAVPRGGLAAERYWVGLWNDAPPQPCDLLRPTTLDSYGVTLDDGQDWLIPAAARVPKTLRLDAGGELVRDVKPKYREFWDRSERWARLLLSIPAEQRKIVVDRDWWDYVCLALEFNYRLTPEVVSHLGLLSESVTIQAIGATVYAREIAEVEAEKKADAPADTPAS